MRIDAGVIEKKLNLVIAAFQKVLYEEDAIFIKNMEQNNLGKDDIGKYRHWEWTQGVGLYGLWKLFERTGDRRYFTMITEYYDKQLAKGLPSKNINTVTPLLTLSYLYEYTKRPEYLEVCLEWAGWIMDGLPRTEEGGFQHITSDSVNAQELWDDTLFMTVLFLTNLGRILDRRDYLEEAKYQFLLHVNYLADKKSGLWYHGWVFGENHNFTGAFWGRGNCWVTIAIPIFLAMIGPERSVGRFLTATLERQVRSLEKLQDPGGMWHTLLDDPASYVEASATSGFAYGILFAVRSGLIDRRYEACAFRALAPILDCIDDEGIVRQVSYGTAMGRKTKAFYKQIPIRPMPYGQAIAILFLMEMAWP